VRDCRLELADGDAQRLEVLIQYRDFFRALEKLVWDIWNRSSIEHQFVYFFRYEQLTAEIHALRPKVQISELGKPPTPIPPPNEPPEGLDPDRVNATDVPDFIRAKLYAVNDA